MDPASTGSSVVEDASPATIRLAAMATFRDGDASRRQIGLQLGALEADFARCLAMSAWAIEKPLRMLVFALPMHTSLDACLLARLRDAVSKARAHSARGAFEHRDLAPLLLEHVIEREVAPAHDGDRAWQRGKEIARGMGRNGNTIRERLQELLATEARAAAGSKQNADDLRWGTGSHE